VATKVDTHVHMIAFGYLALMLSLLGHGLHFQANTKKRLAWVFYAGRIAAYCVFLILTLGWL